MRQWGEGMSRLGFPCGVALVWGVISLQVVCSVLILLRRFVVPACLGHLAVLGTGTIVAHAPHWFVVGPGENGMEFPLTFISCFVGCAIAYWPVRPRAASEAATALPDPVRAAG